MCENFNNLSTEDLKPCPFCGNAPVWVNKVHPSDSPGIRCFECQFTIVDDRIDKTKYLWNRRVEY